MVLNYILGKLTLICIASLDMLPCTLALEVIQLNTILIR